MSFRHVTILGQSLVLSGGYLPGCLVSGRRFFGDLSAMRVLAGEELWNRLCTRQGNLFEGFMGGSVMKVVFAALGLFFSMNLAIAADPIESNHANCDIQFSLNDADLNLMKREAPTVPRSTHKAISNLIIGRPYDVGSFFGYKLSIIAEEVEHGLQATMTVEGPAGKVFTAQELGADGRAILSSTVEKYGDVPINFYCVVKLKN